jgi:hypothetical protein
MPLRDNQKTRRPRLALPPRTGAALSLAAVLLGAACTQDDPRYPAYFRYVVDVKVDGVPVTIERVVKCTGTRSWNTSAAPGRWTGQSYVNPPVIGAKVPGSDAAVYVRVPSACSWAASPETAQQRPPPLVPGDIVPVLWTDNWQRLEQIEYYSTRPSLAGEDSHVEFVRIQPMTRTDKKAFKASEKRAATESPDLRPVARVRAKGHDKPISAPSWLDPDRPKTPAPGMTCFAVLSLDRSKWDQWPTLEPWVDSLPNDGRFYEVRPALGDIATSLNVEGGFFAAQSLNRTSLSEEVTSEEGARRALQLYNSMHPIAPSRGGAYIDKSRQGISSCSFNLWYYDRSYEHHARQPIVERKDRENIKIYSDAKIFTLMIAPDRESVLLIFQLGPIYSSMDEPVAMDTID